MKYIDIFSTADTVKDLDLNGKIAVIIDIFRASTTITTLLENGIKYIVPVLTVEAAYEYRKHNKNILLMGERNGIKPSGFDYGNSPYDLSGKNFTGSAAVITTTNGTKAIHNALSADIIFIGSLRNMYTLADIISALNRSVAVICSGTNSNFSMEDFYAAGILVEYLINNSSKPNFTLTDIAWLSLFTAGLDINTVINEKTCRHYKYLTELGYIKDIEYSIKFNTSHTIPYFDKSNRIIKTYNT